MKETWYEERNKRTDSFSELTKDYYGTKVSIVVTADTSIFGTQVMLNMFTNILARWCSNISITSPDAESKIFCGPDSIGTMLEIVKKGLHVIDPHGHFVFNDVDSSNADFTVFIGKPNENCKTPYLAIDARGWVASCSFNSYAECNGRNTWEANPLGPAFAACLANAELFRWANNIRAEEYCKWYDIYSMTVSDLPIESNIDLIALDFGRLHIIGCGAIGSSFTYLLGLINFTGEILFVDADSGVELHNTSSSLLFNTYNCEGDQKKAEICEAYLSESNYKVQSLNNDYKNYPYDHRNSSTSTDVIMCFANDFDIWSTVQNLYPPVVFHATTSRSWGINIGRHIPLKDNCIMCTFKNLSKVVFVPKCAEVELPVAKENLVEEQIEEEPHASILPFLSPAAAVIALAELIKLTNGKVADENSTQFNMATYQGDFLEDQQKAKNCDICIGQSEAIYRTLEVKLDY